MGRDRNSGITLVQLTVISALSMIALTLLARQIRLEILEVSQARLASEYTHRWRDPLSRLRRDLESAVDYEVKPSEVRIIHYLLNARDQLEVRAISYEIKEDACLASEGPRPCRLLEVRTDGRTEFFRHFESIRWCISPDPRCSDLPAPAGSFVASFEVLQGPDEDTLKVPLAVFLPSKRTLFEKVIPLEVP